MSRIKVSHKQRQFLSSVKRYVVYRGGIGSGKTRILCYRAILNALSGRKELVVANTFTQLRDVVLATFIEVLPLFDIKEFTDYIVNKSDMDIIIRGTYIHLRSAEQDEKLRGINCHDVLIDEARNIKDDKLFLILIGRMRNSDDGQCFICSSPKGKDWVWKLSQDTENVDLITQKTYENPFLSKEYKVDLRRRYTSQYAAQELDAEIIEFNAGVIQSKWFVLIPYIKPMSGIRAWDLAVSIKTAADYAAGALLFNSGHSMCIGSMIHGKFEYPALRQKIIETAQADGRDIHIVIEDAGQQRGYIDDLKQISELKGYVIKALKPRSDKLARALPWISRAELGGISVCEAPWNRAFFDECDSFSADMSHEHDDMIDAVSMAYKALTKPVGSSAKVKLY
jgi:predicted phage terminase large subunit-like protein